MKISLQKEKCIGFAAYLDLRDKNFVALFVLWSVIIEFKKEEKRNEKRNK